MRRIALAAAFLSGLSIVTACTLSALRTQPGGAVVVTVVQDGVEEERTVTVRGSADGLAVVDGVDAGETVRVLNGAP